MGTSKGTPLPEKDRTRLAALVAELGEQTALSEIGINKSTLARALSSLPIYRGTVAMIRERLARDQTPSEAVRARLRRPERLHASERLDVALMVIGANKRRLVQAEKEAAALRIRAARLPPSLRQVNEQMADYMVESARRAAAAAVRQVNRLKARAERSAGKPVPKKKAPKKAPTKAARPRARSQRRAATRPAPSPSDSDPLPAPARISAHDQREVVTLVETAVPDQVRQSVVCPGADLQGAK
jgi:hypothetical protein